MAETKTDLVPHWIGKIKKEEKAHKCWREQAEAAEREFFDDREDKRKHLFNVFFSTVNTLQSRLYSKAPAPDVRRRFEIQGP
jgi:hypothetical protein